MLTPALTAQELIVMTLKKSRTVDFLRLKYVTY